MVVSPEYACQLVFVVNEAAVLKARWAGVTAPNFCGFHGRSPCKRCIRYRTTIETRLKSSMEIAYSVQRISWSSSTPVTRYKNFSTGRSAGSSSVFSRLNTRAMKTPMGLVTRKVTSRNSKIWSHPLAVISELLRPQQSVDQVNGGQCAGHQHDQRLDVHTCSYFTRSQKCTYAMERAKNAMVAAVKARSAMCTSRSFNGGSWNQTSESRLPRTVVVPE